MTKEDLEFMARSADRIDAIARSIAVRPEVLGMGQDATFTNLERAEAESRFRALEMTGPEGGFLISDEMATEMRIQLIKAFHSGKYRERTGALKCIPLRVVIDGKPDVTYERIDAAIRPWVARWVKKQRRKMKRRRLRRRGWR